MYKYLHSLVKVICITLFMYKYLHSSVKDMHNCLFMYYAQFTREDMCNFYLFIYVQVYAEFNKDLHNFYWLITIKGNN